ncbi:GNAT family N-acetyltransferase [Mangrovibrevibacter kandeliae]|uniref:GNAT family N-acetyltransferase n=1 Tax=Mangrovibrevibacter kandeliae TaxID=2968473 RepID=UPI002117D882|nr:GNAT family N-acetyltransferase [Aurantimonas sp. CSK15Z-1]MCQ8781963.1 N-acetyltransferase [Aurantimonas sp. CSK15Z-1]
MEIHHEAHGGRGRFASGGGEETAEMTYHMRGETVVVFDHTFVPPALRGRGLAEQLVAAGVEWAKAEGLRIVPQCSYVAALFQRRPDYRALQAEA